jgi:hypothetical protein
VSALFLALLHYPVLDRHGKIVTSAITSLDLHDLARAARTYGVAAVFVVHPVPDQRAFAMRLLDHWRLGYGREFDSRRREALALIRVVPELDDAIAAIVAASGTRPKLVYTSARARDGVSFEQLRGVLDAPDGAPLLIMLGTGFGMAPAAEERADLVLAPLRGAGDYNHLSVRSAAAIMLDRLRGAR